MDEIIPFTTIPLHKYFQHDLEKIKMAFRLSDTILKDLKNIRAAGDQVELAVKDFFAEKLFPEYFSTAYNRSFSEYNQNLSARL